VAFQEISDHFQSVGDVPAFALRHETFTRIERVTGRPLICYVAKTHQVGRGIPAYIDNSDLTGFADLVHSIPGVAVDVFLVSNGGAAEATERIVRLLRGRFEAVRFIVPANAFSAATLLCFSGDEIAMGAQGTLGPIDPQIDGTPARAVTRAFESVQERLKQEGPQALTAYLPLLQKYSLHILEICKSAQELSEELAADWLSTYMLKCDRDDPRVHSIVEYFASYDLHKSHGRSIDRHKARALGLQAVDLESIDGLADLVRSLYNQYEFFFQRADFFKLYENAHGIHWGHRAPKVGLQLPVVTPINDLPLPPPQPGPPDSTL
jgi:hypothetical protein